MKTAITIVADLVRSLVLSGLAAAGTLLLVAFASATTGYCLWRLWQRARR
jgi:ABC-type glycerol-3-phosphate transport system permease component